MVQVFSGVKCGISGTRMNEPGLPAPRQLNEDARELIALGYAQELFRTMGGF